MQRIAATLLCLGIRVWAIWIPSEWNPADWPSREGRKPRPVNPRSLHIGWSGNAKNFCETLKLVGGSFLGALWVGGTSHGILQSNWSPVLQTNCLEWS